jgi:hypothetical protein
MNSAVNGFVLGRPGFKYRPAILRVLTLIRPGIVRPSWDGRHQKTPRTLPRAICTRQPIIRPHTNRVNKRHTKHEIKKSLFSYRTWLLVPICQLSFIRLIMRMRLQNGTPAIRSHRTERPWDISRERPCNYTYLKLYRYKCSVFCSECSCVFFVIPTTNSRYFPERRHGNSLSCELWNWIFKQVIYFVVKTLNLRRNSSGSLF